MGCGQQCRVCYTWWYRTGEIKSVQKSYGDQFVWTDINYQGFSTIVTSDQRFVFYHVVATYFILNAQYTWGKHNQLYIYTISKSKSLTKFHSPQKTNYVHTFNRKGCWCTFQFQFLVPKCHYHQNFYLKRHQINQSFHYVFVNIKFIFYI